MSMSMMKRYVVGLLAVMVAGSYQPAWAQGAAPPTPPPASAAPPTPAPATVAPTPATSSPKLPAIPLKVTVVISRFQGEKRTSNLPYVLSCLTGSNSGLRMQNQVPMPSAKPDASQVAGSAPPISVTYQSVGTSMDCNAEPNLGDDVFRLYLTVADSQVVGAEGGKATNGLTGAWSQLPWIQQFSSTTRLLLRDGQTVQYTAAVDKTTGEVLKLEVTLNVIK